MASRTDLEFGRRQADTPSKMTTVTREVLKQALQKEIDILEIHLRAFHLNTDWRC